VGVALGSSQKFGVPFNIPATASLSSALAELLVYIATRLLSLSVLCILLSQQQQYSEFLCSVIKFIYENKQIQHRLANSSSYE